MTDLPEASGFRKPGLVGLVDISGHINPAYLSVVKNFTLSVGWSSMQPDPAGALNTSVIDSALNYCAGLGDPEVGLLLRAFAGGHSPGWVLQLAGGPVSMTDPQGPVTAPCPIWWDPAVGHAYAALQEGLAARYDANPFIHEVACTRAMSIYGEPFMRGGQHNRDALVAKGFTEAADLASIGASVANVLSHWHHTPAELALNPYQSQFGPASPATTIEVAEAARAKWGARLVLSNHSIRWPRITGSYGPMYAYMTGQKPLTFQTATLLPPRIGDLMKTLEDAVAMGAQAVELPGGYPTVVRPADLQPIADGLKANAAA